MSRSRVAWRCLHAEFVRMVLDRYDSMHKTESKTEESGDSSEEAELARLKRRNAAVKTSLEAVGFSVGQRAMECLSYGESLLRDTTEKLKFICEVLWPEVFGRMVDRLEHDSGVYWIEDSQHALLQRISASNPKLLPSQTLPYACFSIGLLKGACALLGLNAQVKCETANPPKLVLCIVDHARVLSLHRERTFMAVREREEVKRQAQRRSTRSVSKPRNPAPARKQKDMFEDSMF